MADFSGRTIDNYLLLRRLGKGAFGEVYLAEHVRRKTLFAMKILRTQLGEANLRAFLNEARVFRLVHPHIMGVRDFRIDSNVLFILMDDLPNGNLRELYPYGKPLPLKTIVSYVKQVAGAGLVPR
ncbi:MAG TPA: protein kinase [Ktedonobacteraceae bacterium]|nr:protein kinase [Ktedonobacteraceae bacterium]